MKGTYFIQTLGCKVNQYESEQIATLLRAHGFSPGLSAEDADLRIVNTCSVTMQAASKSRQAVRKAIALPVLGAKTEADSPWPAISGKTIVTGCWATSNRAEAKAIPGVDAVLTHHQNVAEELERILESFGQAKRKSLDPIPPKNAGTTTLPLLNSHQTGHQRAMLKVQDGCDAHCTYCIIPKLRPGLWSKSIDDAVDEAKRLVDAGHVEIVLTGIFLGAYGQETALRRRQTLGQAGPIGRLIDALCTRVPGLRRLRFSSLEPGDLTTDLMKIMRSYEQIVPHFHLPLQSGSEFILRRMNRQYGRDDFRRMIEEIHSHFKRPAITTDIIVGFPGESDEEFSSTLQVVVESKFIHIHAFSYSPRPGTAAARWTRDFVRGPVVNQRIEQLAHLAAEHSLSFRQQFVGETVELLVEQSKPFDDLRHGRCERYFDVHFDHPEVSAGDLVKVRIDRVSPARTFGTLVHRSRREVVTT